MANDDLVGLTGISGFIAKHVALLLLAEGYRVRGTVRSLKKAEGVVNTLSGHGADVSRLEIVEADLDDDRGWPAAVAGCRYVLHTASPFPSRQPRQKTGLVAVARGGALRVLDAAKRAGVQRLVLTSSVAAVYYGHGARADAVFGEADFSDVGSSDISPYAVSKTEAERAAWEAVAGSGLELVAINPALVLGPLLDDQVGTSAGLIATMMRGWMPVVPRISLGIVDVRDVAAAHIAAMRVDEAAGRRFILSAGSRSLRDTGSIIARRCPRYASRMPRATLPDFLVRAAARVSWQASPVAAELGREKRVVTEPAETVLGLRFRSPEDAIGSMAESIAERGLA